MWRFCNRGQKSGQRPFAKVALGERIGMYKLWDAEDRGGKKASGF